VRVQIEIATIILVYLSRPCATTAWRNHAALIFTWELGRWHVRIVRFGPIYASEDAFFLSEEDIHRQSIPFSKALVGGVAWRQLFGVTNMCGEVKFEPCYYGNPLVKRLLAAGKARGNFLR